MGSSSNPPAIDEVSEMAFSPRAASTLMITNALVAQLRAIPERLMTSDVQERRARLLGVHLPELLTLHRDARAAGSQRADEDLADSLEHVDGEVRRLIRAASTPHQNALEHKSAFLGSRYELDGRSDEVAEEIRGSCRTATPDAKREDHATGVRVDRASLSALFEAPAEPKSGAALAGLVPIILMLMFGMSLVANKADLFGGEDDLVSGSVDKIAAERSFDAKITALSRVAGDYEGDAPQAQVTYSGVVTNNAKTSIEYMNMEIQLYSCPEPASPLSQCTWVKGINDYPGRMMHITPGVTSRFKGVAKTPIPDVTGHLRATLGLSAISYAKTEVVWKP
jgi:hypothetical protein